MGPAAPSCTGSLCPAEACHTEPPHKSEWAGSHQHRTSSLEGSRQKAERQVGVVVTQVRQMEHRLLPLTESETKTEVGVLQKLVEGIEYITCKISFSLRLSVHLTLFYT